jgi:two-component system chemotaxis sensor kinase CheA
VIQSARHSAKTAEAIGSIEDLAELSDRMRDVVSSLQSERARIAWATGQKLSIVEVTGKERQVTDISLKRLNEFVSSRDRSMLPPKLGRELGNALLQLQELPKFRAELAGGGVPLERQLNFYSNPASSLVYATAALNELSDDGSLLRSISSLASAMEVKERQSLEQALLAHAFALKEFPPGSFRMFVTVHTEEEVYTASFIRAASERERNLFNQTLESPASKAADVLKKQALESTDELNVDSTLWFNTQAQLVNDLGRLEHDFGGQVRRAAVGKLVEAKQAVRLGVGLTVGVLLVSMLLAILIARGVVRSVTSLSHATEKVRLDQDFSVRAKRLTLDEIGKLTDAFNEMLSGIQDRDRRLAEHSEQLEQLVADRTAELSARNAAMRVVLDNVAIGLATADLKGCLSQERSAAFDRWFGTPGADIPFGQHLAAGDTKLSGMFKVAYDQVIDDLLPMDVNIEMMPKRLERDGLYYSLEYAPVMRDDQLNGLLLMVADVTSRVHAEQAEVEQREQVKTFQRVLNDRAGFVEFFAEARNLVERIRDDSFADDAERRRVVHTLKGNASLYELSTVTTAAHELEQAFDDATQEEIVERREFLVSTWDSFATRAVSLLGEDVGDRFELSKVELENLLTLIRNGASREEIESRVARLAFEPMQARLGRIGSHLRGLAKRLGKSEPKIVIKDGDVRLPPTQFAPLWASFSHLVRNIVDHGLDEPEAREKAGKPRQPCVELAVDETPHGIIIVVSDDGRGIDWDVVREKAKSKGLPHKTIADLKVALVSPGFSTASTVTSTSGRGVGLSAVAIAAESLGGNLNVDSAKGKGTKFTIALSALSQMKDSVSPRLSDRPLSVHPKA